MVEAPNELPLILLGATGQIGESVVAQCRVRPLIAVARRIPADAKSETCRWTVADLAAGPLNLPTLHAVGAIATVPIWLLPALVPALHSAGIQRLVCFSSTSVFGKQTSRSAYEQGQVAALTKGEVATTEACGRAGIALTILRPTLIYGKGRDQTITAAARFIRRFGCFPILGRAAGLRQPVHADDLAAAALTALAAPSSFGQSYNLGGAETLTYRAMIERVFAALGRPPRLLSVPFLPFAAAALGRLRGNPVLTADVARRMNVDLVFDDGAATRDFGYAPRKFLSGGRRDLGI
jgi:nucleoside-diphosphate-sugar epimerase